MMKVILKSLVTNTCLEYLDLSSNNIGCMGAEMISHLNGLQYNNTLVTILLNNNKIDINGITALDYARKNGLKNLIYIKY